MAESLDFRSWCQTQGLTENTIHMLLNHGFKNQETLRLVTQPIIDTELKTENLGQRLLLNEAIHKLWMTSTSGSGGLIQHGSVIPGPASYIAPPAYDRLTHGNQPPGTGELFPLETLYPSNTRLTPLQGVHPPPNSMTFPPVQSISTPELPIGSSTQPGLPATSKARSTAKHASVKKIHVIPAPKNAAKVLHVTSIEDKIVVATEQHPEKHSKANKTKHVSEMAISAPTHGAEFVHTHTSIDDRIAVATEHHLEKHSKTKMQNAPESIPASRHGAEFVHTHTSIDDKIAVATEHHLEKHSKTKTHQASEVIPPATHGAEFVHTHTTIDDKIVVATEHHPQEHSNTAQTAKDPIPAPTHGAEFVHTHTTIDDRIAVATEQQQPPKQPKKKTPFSYANPYGKAMIDLTGLAFWFCFPLLGISIASPFLKTSTWKYFTGLWVFIIISLAVWYGDKMKQLPAENNVVQTFFKVMSVLLFLALVACLATMAVSAYGMYIDREIHVNGTSCDDELLKTLELKCDNVTANASFEENVTSKTPTEHNITSNATYTGPNFIGWNERQALHTANIVLAYVVFVIVVWALYARHDLIEGLPQATFKDETEKGFINTSFMFKLTPITFPLLSVLEAIFKTTMWQLFLPEISGCALLISGFHAHRLHFLPQGEQKKKRYKVQLILLIISMVVVLTMVGVHGTGIGLDEEIHEYGVSCDEIYIQYFNYTCEFENTADETEYTTHAYLKTEDLNYKQGIHVGIVALGVFHVFFLFIAIKSGNAFMTQHGLKCC
ncbi:unnamed protein product [Owenia fusiformis]|uniref:Uncharacterized protein n=1 Tax=Owenia fusiformis TaxID=6347 RepID=A0A8J1U1Z5_OWEFU|nr:unnamed protein product [Owenia fusiformis]